MILTNEQLQKIYYGALYFEETQDGYLKSFQYIKPQMAHFEKISEFYYDRCMASSAKTLEFTTSEEKFSFDYKIVWIGSLDSIELEVDGLISKIYHVKDIEKEGTLSFDLPKGEKKVVVYLPADATIWLKNFEIGSMPVPAKKGEKVLWMGDSITQGYGPLRSAHTYVSVANKILNYDIINQGIGGYVYDKYVLMDMDGYRPDKIIIAMGTNQHRDNNMKVVEDYYEVLHSIYGDTPVLCVTPIWRGDTEDDTKMLQKFCEDTKKICEKYDNITVVEGFKLVPHASEYFLDNLHPNVIGSELYGRNLADAIIKAGF